MPPILTVPCRDISNSIASCIRSPGRSSISREYGRASLTRTIGICPEAAAEGRGGEAIDPVAVVQSLRAFPQIEVISAPAKRECHSVLSRPGGLGQRMTKASSTCRAPVESAMSAGVRFTASRRPSGKIDDVLSAVHTFQANKSVPHAAQVRASEQWRAPMGDTHLSSIR